MVALLLLLPVEALASGYYYVDSGIIPNGRAGAWVAGADSAFAQKYNPAGLVRVERPTFHVGATAVAQNVSFTRMTEDGAFLDPAVNNQPVFTIPQFGFATPLPRDLALAIGFYSPFSPGTRYAADGPQRYTMIDSMIYQFAVGPSLAWRPLDQLAVGVGLQWQYFLMGQELKATTSGTDDPRHDVHVKGRIEDVFTPSANLGVLIEPVEQVSIGLSVQPTAAYRGTGHATLDFTGHFLEENLDQPTWTDDEVTLAVSLPWELRGGVAVRPRENVEIEAAFGWQSWKQLKAIVVEDIDLTVTGEVGTLPIEQEVPERLELPAGFHNTWSVRLGGEVDLKDVELRAGAQFETGAVPAEKVSVALVDTNKLQLAGGASVHMGPVIVDGAGCVILFPRMDLRDSAVDQINAADTEGPALVVGNGDLRAVGWMVGLQARLELGKR